MEPEHIHAPGEGQPKHSTQIISLFVGGLLFILGLSGILFSGFAGFHLSPIYSTIIAASGVTLFYNGYKNNARDAFMACLGFSIFFGLHALAGWIFGEPGVPRVGNVHVDSKWLVIIPHVHELGKTDHILNTILSLVLMGGAIDWWARHTERGNWKSMARDIVKDYRDRYRSRHNRPIRH